MRVVKLGGSLLSNNSLMDCLAKIKRLSSSTLIVMGGGEFAEQVRVAQQRWQFNDAAAHHMAVLAMQQMALLVHALQPEWPLLKASVELQNWRAQPQTSVWFPVMEHLDQQAIPASWRVTSDSLAAWLAGATGVDELLIVKAAPLLTSTPLQELVATGILDAAFLDYVSDSYTTKIINSQDFLDHLQ